MTTTPNPLALVGLPQLRLVALMILSAPLLLGAVLAYLVFSGELKVPLGELGVPHADLAAAGFGVLVYVVGFMVRGHLQRQASSLSEGPPRRGRYVAGVIVLFACLEAGMLINLVAVLLVASPWWNLTIAGLGLAIGLNFLPSEEHYQGIGS